MSAGPTFGLALAVACLLTPATEACAQGGGFTLSPPQNARGYCLRDRVTLETVCAYASIAQCRKAAKGRQADCLLSSNIEGGKDLLHGR